jgi:hypothetical protein
MKLRGQATEVAATIRHRQSRRQGIDQPYAAGFMAGVTRQFVLRRRGLAQIVNERSETHIDVSRQFRRLFEHHQSV